MDSEPMHFDRTTPESPELNDFFYRSVARGVNAACMEVSSHSIDLHRVSHLNFDYFAFTNLTQDHLDYHETMERYFEVKSRLFLPGFRKIFGGKGSVLNIDDPYGKTLLERTDLDVMTCSI
jgi:UDP-N-acetylmuramoyl-L-alanyl-D-glutamate--2,6-diaminopimelate ligase